MNYYPNTHQRDNHAYKNESRDVATTTNTDDKINNLEHMVLMLDVNAKYGPYMVPMERLFQAVKTKESNGNYRGIIKLYFGPLDEKKLDEKQE